MAKVAVVGSGISGLTCAYLLRNDHEITLFEKNDYLGGHTHTHKIEIDNLPTTVDTGFIVYNDRTYPNFIKLLRELDCAGVPTEMSFSLRDEAADMEYNGHNLDSLFAQRTNLFRPSFWLMIRDILRFNKMAKTIDPGEKNLDEFIAEHRFSKIFASRYLYPMAAAIWSTGDEAIGQFPIRSLIDFFVNHGLVDLKNRPQWFVVKGGSNQYINAMLPHLKDIRLSTGVKRIVRSTSAVLIETEANTEAFDEVILACHSDEALKLLAEPSREEQQILSAIRFSKNTAYLHTDRSRLPNRPKAWASWNYSIPRNKTADQARLTYNMNILQHIPSRTQVLVTLNDPDIKPDTIIKTIEYSHPFYDAHMVKAQNRHGEISAQNRTHYCGAYWHYGFHEDGVKSALRVCQALGVRW